MGQNEMEPHVWSPVERPVRPATVKAQPTLAPLPHKATICTASITHNRCGASCTQLAPTQLLRPGVAPCAMPASTNACSYNASGSLRDCRGARARMRNVTGRQPCERHNLNTPPARPTSLAQPSELPPRSRLCPAQLQPPKYDNWRATFRRRNPLDQRPQTSLPHGEHPFLQTCEL